MIKYIEAKVVYNDFEGGFWGLIDKNGKEYLPTNMPRQLMAIGKIATIGYTYSDQMSTYMWGELIDIVQFETLYL